jgi:polysaccharide biosynthesis protein PslG
MRSSARIGAIVCLVLAALTIVPAAGGSIAKAAASRLDRLIDSGSFGGGLGVNINFTPHSRGEIAAIARAGFHLVRSDLLWAQVETVKGRYDWRPYDGLIADLRANHLVPLLILDYSNPLYAKRLFNHPITDGRAYQSPIEGAARTAFMAFAREAAKHYGSDVIWEIWNEPDHNFGDPVDRSGYVAFAMEACRVIRAVESEAPVIAPAVSGFDWPLLEAVKNADGSGCLDAISLHPYIDEAPESVLRDWARAQGLVMQCPISPRCPALVDSEWGYSVTGGRWTQQLQADYVTRMRFVDMVAGVKLTIVYDWRNDGPDPADKEANFGLLDFYGTPKPVFRAVSGMVRDLADLRYMGPIRGARPGDIVLAFGDEDIVRKLVGWSAAGSTALTALPDPICGPYRSTRPESNPACLSKGAASLLAARLQLSGTPAVFTLDPLAPINRSEHPSESR